MLKCVNNDEIIYIGTAKQCRNLYKSLYNNNDYHPVFEEFPKFNSDKIYGVTIDNELNFSIIGENSIKLMLKSGVY